MVCMKEAPARPEPQAVFYVVRDGRVAVASAAAPIPAPAAEPAKAETAPAPAEKPKAAPIPEPVPAPAPVASAPKSAPEPLPAEPITRGRDVYVPVKSRAKASVVARRNNVPVADFCRWNDVTPNTMLTAGTMVFLVEPPSPVKTAAAPAPAQPAASASPALQTPTPEQISRKPSLPKEAEPAPAVVPVAASVPAPAAPATSPAVYTALEPLPGSEPVAPAVPEQAWEITRGQMLRSQMEGWAAVAGYSLVWNARHDYEMRSSATFTGSFHDAVKRFYAALQANGLALRVTIYEGNKVMEVNEH